MSQSATRSGTPAPLSGGAAWLDRRLVAAAAILVVLGLVGSVIANAVVGPSGSLLGAGGIDLFPQSPASTPASATAPTPVADPSGSPLPLTAPEIVGVVPGRGQTGKSGQPWTGDAVQVNYQAHGFAIDAARCKLLVDGSTVGARVQSIELSAATQTLRWSVPDGPHASGDYHFEIVLVTTDGQRFAYAWTYDF